MDLRDYLRTLSRHWILITAAILAGIVGGAAASVLAKPTFTAETQLFVALQNSGSVQELQQGNTFSQARVQSYVRIIDSPTILQPALDSLGLSDSPENLSKRVTASTDLNTVLINISVSDTSPVRAAATAQAVADSLVTTVEALEKPRDGGTSPVSLSVIKPAVAPSVPSSPNTKLNLLVGLFLGFMTGILTALIRSSLDNRIRGESDLRRVTDAPLLGGISFDQSAAKKPLLTQTPPQSPRAESFRQMRTNLSFANISGKAKSVLVTSSLPGEGKSTTATNLAISLAQAGHVVCLIDADLRRPMIDQYLGLDRSAGLTTALLGSADINDLLQPWGDDNLHVLTAGQIPPNPSELLGSAAMHNLLMNLEQSFDTVVIDAPPLLPVTDAAVLSQHVGGVVVVVGSQKLRLQDLEKSLNALAMVNSNILGIVLNRLPVRGPDAYAYSYYGPTEADTRRESPRAKRSATLLRTRKSANTGPSSFESLLESDSRPAPKLFPLNRSTGGRG